MATPIRCFEGDAKPHEPFWTWVNVEDDGPSVLEVDGVLSQFSWLDDEITPKLFKEQLYENGKGGPVLMKLNSPGGDVIAAAKIRDIMRDYPGKITVQVSGMAASAAVMVAISGDTVEISDASYMMIHDPMVVVMMAALNIETLSRLQNNLKSIKDGIIPAYAQKTGLSEGVISNMMTRETWMSAREAVEKGFADAILDGDERGVDMSIQNVAYVNAHYGNVPEALLNVSVDESPVSEADEKPLDVERERNLERLRDRVTNLRKGE